MITPGRPAFHKSRPEKQTDLRSKPRSRVGLSIDVIDVIIVDSFTHDVEYSAYDWFNEFQSDKTLQSKKTLGTFLEMFWRPFSTSFFFLQLLRTWRLEKTRMDTLDVPFSSTLLTS